LKLKIGDFGLVRSNPSSKKDQETIASSKSSSPPPMYSGSNSSSHAGTPLYQSPEQLISAFNKGAKSFLILTEKVDIYAAGLILFELSYIFTTQHEKTESLRNLRESRFLPTQGLSDNQRRLILSMTHPEVEKRPTADEILASPLLAHWTTDIKDKQ
jgi:serine/threonine protein kinase